MGNCKPVKKTCVICGNEFMAKRKNVRTCSSVCSHKLAVKVMVERNHQFKRYLNVNDKFLKEECAVKYYYLGLMASDGNIHKTSVGISQSGEEGLKLITYLKKILNADSNIHKSCPKRGKVVYSLSYRSKEIQEDLLQNNICPNKTLTFQIPYYIIKDTEKLRYFLIGYIDGDGCVGRYRGHKNKGKDYYYLSISFVCNDKMFSQLKSLQEFKDTCIVKKKNTLFEFRFCGKKAQIFGEWLYSNLSKDVFKSYKTLNYMEYMNNMDNYVSERFKLIELRRKIFNWLDSLGINNLITSNEIAKRFNIKQSQAERLKYLWRKSHGISRKINKE